jgi:hypothetical protein
MTISETRNGDGLGLGGAAVEPPRAPGRQVGRRVSERADEQPWCSQGEGGCPSEGQGRVLDPSHTHSACGAPCAPDWIYAQHPRQTTSRKYAIMRPIGKGRT